VTLRAHGRGGFLAAFNWITTRKDRSEARAARVPGGAVDANALADPLLALRAAIGDTVERLPH